LSVVQRTSTGLLETMTSPINHLFPSSQVCKCEHTLVSYVLALSKPILYNKGMTTKQNPEWIRTLNITEAEEAVLVSIARYFVDMGLPDDIDESDFDTLVEKICEPSPFDYATN